MNFDSLNKPGGYLAIFLLMIVLTGIGYIRGVAHAGDAVVIFTYLLVHQMDPNSKVLSTVPAFSVISKVSEGELPK